MSSKLIPRHRYSQQTEVPFLEEIAGGSVLEERSEGLSCAGCGRGTPACATMNALA